MTPLKQGLLVLALLVGLGVLAQLPRPAEPSLREYQVYRAFLSNREGEGAVADVLVHETSDVYHYLEDPIVPDELDTFLKRLDPPTALRPGLVDSYAQANAASKTIDGSRLDFPPERIVPLSIFDTAYPDDPAGHQWWAEFHTTYGADASILRLSRVGFSDDGTQALLSVGTSCGGLCGIGVYLLFEWAPEGWQYRSGLAAWYTAFPPPNKALQLTVATPGAPEHRPSSRLRRARGSSPLAAPLVVLPCKSAAPAAERPIR